MTAPPPPSPTQYWQSGRFAIVLWEALIGKREYLYWNGCDWGPRKDARVFSKLMDCFEYCHKMGLHEGLMVQGNKARPLGSPNEIG